MLLAPQVAVPPPASQPAPNSTPVSPLTVTAPPREPPRLVSSWPAQDASTAPGTTVVKLAFDQSMAPGRWSYGPVPGAAYPRCLDRPRLLADGKTFVLLCVTTPSGGYAVRLNPPVAPEAGSSVGPGGFANAGGRALEPVDLRFATTDDRPVASLEDALKAASLEPSDSPVMDERDQPTPPGVEPGKDAPLPAPADPY